MGNLGAANVRLVSRDIMFTYFTIGRAGYGATTDGLVCDSTQTLNYVQFIYVF